MQTPAMTFRDAVNLRTHLRGGEKGVAASVHRGAAGVRGLSAKGDRVAFDAEGAEHGAERQIRIEQDRPLFDMQLEIGGGVAQFFAAILDAFEIDSVLGECIDQRNPVPVLQARASSMSR